jgi:hypothetical protein
LTTVYKRPKEEDTFECHECKTVWRDEWLLADGKPLGWCPSCGEANIPTEIIRLPEVVNKPYATEIKRELSIIRAEAEYKEADLKLRTHECTPLSSDGAEELHGRHMADLEQMSHLRSIMINRLLTISEANVTKSK